MFQLYIICCMLLILLVLAGLIVLRCQTAIKDLKQERDGITRQLWEKNELLSQERAYTRRLRAELARLETSRPPLKLDAEAFAHARHQLEVATAEAVASRKLVDLPEGVDTAAQVPCKHCGKVLGQHNIDGNCLGECDGVPVALTTTYEPVV